ncbi:glutaredoxin domain-containing protein, partial [Oenococcus oeni]
MTVYTKNNCPQCKATKRWLNEHNIDYQEIN